MADLTKAEISAQISDASVATVLDGITLPVGMEPAEFLSKILDGAAKAARVKNGTTAAGSAGYVAGYPAPTISTNTDATTGETIIRAIFGVRVEYPATLDEAASPSR